MDSPGNKDNENSKLKLFGGIAAISLSLLGFIAYRRFSQNKNLAVICKEPNVELTKKLIKQGLETFSMEYSTHYLSNHLSHGLVALCFSGASEDKLQDFYNKYTRKLEKMPKKAGIKIDTANFKEFAGKAEYYPDFLEFFTRELQQGKSKVMDIFVPFLASGMIGAAFHGIIQLGWSADLRLGDIGQFAPGLAYCLASHHDVGKLTESNVKVIPPLETIIKIFNDLGQNKAFDGLINKETMKRFIPRIEAIQNNKTALQEITKYDLNVEDTAQNMQTMMDAIMRVAYMIGVDNFFVIHLVTSMRALKTTYRSMDKEIHCSLMNYFWRCALLSYVSLGCPPLQTDRPLDEKNYDWDALIKDLFSRDVDTHIIKLVFVAREENEEVKNSKGSSDNDENFYFNFAKRASDVKDWIF